MSRAKKQRANHLRVPLLNTNVDDALIRFKVRASHVPMQSPVVSKLIQKSLTDTHPKDNASPPDERKWL